MVRTPQHHPPPAVDTQAFTAPARSAARRRAVLDRLLAADRLPTPPAVAMQIVKETSSPDVTVARIGELLRQDPAICAQVLKAINSCVYALPEAVASVERAVLLLGLNTVRGLVLTLSLPAMQLPGVPDRAFRDFWQSAVSGAVIGRELAVRLKVPTAEDEMLAGLLRDIGLLLLHQSYPAEFADFARGMAGGRSAGGASTSGRCSGWTTPRCRPSCSPAGTCPSRSSSRSATTTARPACPPPANCWSGVSGSGSWTRSPTWTWSPTTRRRWTRCWPPPATGTG
ncbi:MAG: HDOD domain-containing protein [Gemmataceae bacterium]